MASTLQCFLNSLSTGSPSTAPGSPAAASSSSACSGLSAFPQPRPSFEQVAEEEAEALFSTCLRPPTFVRRIAPLLFSADDLHKPLEEREPERVLELRRLLSHFNRPRTAITELNAWNECVDSLNRQVLRQEAADAAELFVKPKRGRPRKYGK